MTEDRLSVLLVDDVEENLIALEAALAPLGHRLVKVRSGEDALRELLRDEDFAAVVLDVQMPGLDGFATAEAIRQRDRTREIPIIFLTAISRDEDHRLRGFAAGAVDYIFKPVEPELLKAKVAVFVRLFAADRELRRQREDLRAKADELARSNADLDQFASVASHDLVEPLNVVAGYIELLSDRLDDRLDEEERSWVRRMDECVQRMHALVTDLLTFSRAAGEGGTTTAGSVQLADALADATANLTSLLSDHSRVVEVSGLPAVRGSRHEVAQVFQNLISNSLLHSGGGPTRVDVSGEAVDGVVTVRVSDDGPGLSPSQMERVFGMFERSPRGPTPTTGLGLPICRRIIGRLGGRIWMEANASGPGLSVLFSLPEAR